MKRYILFLFVIFSLACKKEGLSKSTGNVEIIVPDGEWVPDWTYVIYTEEQYNRFLNHQEAHAVRSGLSHIGKIEEKGLIQGNYGIYFYQTGTGHKRAFQIVANKVNKFTMP